MKKKRLVVTLILILLLVAGIVIYMYLNKPTHKKKKKEEKQEEVIIPKLNIFNTDSTERPIAVMINNHNQARPYHSGLQDAQIIYEMVVEGGITRMMAVFKDQATARIGSVRSSRHNFLDYAMENDAIYVHFGWSPQAQNDIANFGINNLNGLYDSGFWRDTDLYNYVNLEHTAYTNIENIKNASIAKGYRMNYNSNDVESELVLKYSIDEINLKPNLSEEQLAEMETDFMVANNVTIPYSNYMTVSYRYDPENKYYLRFANDVEHKDYITGLQYHFKNIIIANIQNYSCDSYGRQDFKNIGTGSGYYITNGYARPITWEKTARNAKTIYRYLDGEEIKVNDGNTFIQIEPITYTPTITE